MLALGTALSGCAGLEGGAKTPEEIVAQRAQMRWDALVAGDWERAYSFATPAYRDVVDVGGFRRQQGGQVNVLGAEVREVRCEQQDVCEAMVTLKFRSPLPPFKSVLKTDYPERWLYEDGHWWIFLRP